VRFSLDIRSKEDSRLSQLEDLLKSEFAKIAAGEGIGGVNDLGTKGRGCKVEWQLDTDSPATKFNKDCINCVEASAKDMLGTNAGIGAQRMTSGAGHDR
jgi:metal-dependent amidase/aminoacylase/carboxypeptidase family protein